MLGRFVVPAPEILTLDRLAATANRGGRFNPWWVAAVAGSDPQAECEALADQLQHLTNCRVEAFECRAPDGKTVRQVNEVLRAVGGIECIVELPPDGGEGAILDAVRNCGVFAKIRTGAATASGIPDASTVVRLVRACLTAGVAFKFTAGLHHPITGDYALTYAPGAERARMFGYVNAFLAAAFMRAGMSDADAAALLEERDASQFVIDAGAIRWRGHILNADDADRTRDLVISFGSCSFREPVDELAERVLARSS
jgi:hypothetical protein